MMKYHFAPIKMEKYIELHLKGNPGTPRKEITEGLSSALEDYKNGNPIWVIGSAVAGNACFTCITGEAVPDGDYEIDEACIGGIHGK